jgi:hypothetical protein
MTTSFSIVGMALGRGQGLGDRQGAQGDALVELHVVADDGRLADDDAGAVVDDHGVAQRRAGVDVDAGPLVRPFGQHARQERHAQFVEAVGDAVDGDGEEAGVGQDHLVDALGRGVAALDGRGVDHQLAVDLGQGLEEGAPRSRPGSSISPSSGRSSDRSSAAEASSASRTSPDVAVVCSAACGKSVSSRPRIHARREPWRAACRGRSARTPWTRAASPSSGSKKAAVPD